MGDVQIRETIVTPNAGGAVVQLYISDAARESTDAAREPEYAAIRLALTVQVPALDCPLLVHIQRAAIEAARNYLREVDDELGKELSRSGLVSSSSARVLGKR